jgi:hypothetical protein
MPQEPGSITKYENGPLTPSPNKGTPGTGGTPQQNGPLTPSPNRGK